MSVPENVKVPVTDPPLAERELSVGEMLTTKVGGGFDIAELKRRMSQMETLLDQAMFDQSKLF